MLPWERTSFENFYRQVFHVCPYNAAYYPELVQKFGGDNVFMPPSAAAQQLAIEAAYKKVVHGANDCIKLWPGTYVFSALVTLGLKGVTIEGASPNLSDAVLDCATSDVQCFTAGTAIGVTLRGFTILEANTGTANCIGFDGNCHGALIENLRIYGGAIASTTATIYLSGHRSIVRNNFLTNIRKGITLGGNDSVATGNYVYTTNNTAGNLGIELTGVSARTGQRAVRNTIVMIGANNTGINVATNADLAEVSENFIMAGSAANMIATQADTYGVANIELVANSTVTAPTWINGAT